MVGLGEALHRLDDDESALADVGGGDAAPRQPVTYAAWRNVAAAGSGAGDLRGALAAYREADRRAPERGQGRDRVRGWAGCRRSWATRGAAGKYFAKARGDQGLSFAVGIIVVTTVISLPGELPRPPGRRPRTSSWRSTRSLLADGELWRLWTVTLVHAALHQMPAPPAVQHVRAVPRRAARRAHVRPLAVPRLLPAVRAGRVARVVRVQRRPRPGVGASGAIFGLFGLLFAAQRIHRPIIDRQARAFMGQLGGCS